MAKLVDIIKVSKIDFTNIIVETDNYLNLNYNLEIEPSEFLDYAKFDLLEGTRKGLINSISNVKRAIDCQVDKTLLSFGFDISKLPPYINDFIRIFNKSNDSAMQKLLVLNCLNIAPSKVISDIRKFRHKLEHEYKIPSKKQVTDATEIAELFINAVENKLIKSFSFRVMTILA